MRSAVPRRMDPTMTDAPIPSASENPSADEPLSDLDEALDQAAGGIQVLHVDKSGQIARPTHSWA